MEKTKIMVSGCHGKMGEIVCNLINSREDMYVLFGFDTTIKVSNFNVCHTIEDLEKKHTLPDIIIDFSKPDCTMNVLENFACKHQIPIVIGTTGYENEALHFIKSCSEQTLVFLSSNMSYTVSIFEQILRDLGPKMSGYEIEIVETLHNRDNSSAQTLVHALNAYLKKPKEIVYDRTGKRNPDEIGIASLLGGNIVETHTVRFIGESDMFELTHTSSSKEMFAEGALRAAQFLLKQKSNGISHGFFNMKNMM